jgi:hypothetical protein
LDTLKGAHAVVADAEFEFRTVLQPFVREIFQPAPISSILSCTVSRMPDGRSSNAFENVGDQIWSAAATVH